MKRKIETFPHYINKLFESREMANAFHYCVEHNNLHTFLEEYYSKIINLYDELIEMYQGKYGIINEPYEIIIAERGNDVVGYFEDTVKQLEKSVDKVFDKNDTFLLSKNDEIIGLLYKIIYKMKYLK